MSKRTALDRLYKLAKAEEERKKKLKQAEEERQKKVEAEQEELLNKAKVDFADKQYKKYLKLYKKSASDFSILDFMYLMNRDDIGWTNLQTKPQQPVQQQPQYPVHNHGGNVTNTPTGE